VTTAEISGSDADETTHLADGLIHLEVLTPARVVVDDRASTVSAEARNGSFTLLPRHIDFTASLVPGLLTYTVGEQEHLLAVDAGILVKRGPSVRVATGGAVEGDSVLSLQRQLRASFKDTTESEQQTRAALAHLETDAFRRLLELEDHD
jgi:F-type H+-transporting ATPase subunit epsilon